MKILISIFFILIVAFLTSKLKMNVKYIEKEKNCRSIKFHVNFGLYLFGIVKILGISLKQDGIYFLGFQFSYHKIKIDQDSMKIFKEFSVAKLLQSLHPKLEKLNLKLKIGTEDVIFTAFLVFVISTFLSIFVAKNGKTIHPKNYDYEIIPVYNKNELSFQFSSKISLKTLNIIKTLHWAKKNGKEKKYRPQQKKIPVKI